jgi:hypothetical protein
MANWDLDSTDEANLMKIKYGKMIEKQFNQSSVILGRIKKSDKFVGKQLDRPVIQSIGGGVGNGSLPTSNPNKIGLARLNDIKKLYAVVGIDRETMKASKSDEGAFVRFTKFPVQIATKSFNRNLERQIIRNDVAGAGALITGNACNTAVSGAGSSATPYVVSFDKASTYFPAEFEAIEEGDILHASTEATDLVVSSMSVTVADGYATGSISLVGSSILLGADVCGCTAFAESLYMQNSKDNELDGIKGVLAATSGTYKNISVGRRWQSYRKSAASAAISTDLLNDVVLNVKRQSGESPNLILMSYHQYVKLLNILEDQKTYNLPARDKKLKGQVSFSGIEYMSADGAIPVMPSRFMDSDKVYFLNDNHIELHLRPGGFEWFDEDGTVFLRETTDSYEARYGGYGELFINPHFQGELHTLAV